jgi:predicted PurR-regulated permease PerM
MKIKQKLYLGIGLLFLMIAVLTVLSTVYINKLSKETKNILVANYNTIDYSRNMLIALNNDISNPEHQAFFESNLIKQKNNITEVGEMELTDKLANDFVKIKENPNDLLLIKNGSDNGIKVNNEGVLQFLSQSSVPTAIGGGIYYSGSAFYVGID